MNTRNERLKGVILDWAGTTVDYGSRAPAEVFREIFDRRDVPITVEEARGPMGMAKHAHIQTVMELPRVADAWAKRYGRAPDSGDVNALYEQFIPLQRDILGRMTDVIPGVVPVLDACRERGLRIGSSTGYTRTLMDVVAPLAKAQGYAPDCILCSDDVPAGRPAPWLNLHVAEKLDIYPLRHIVIVDDTGLGIDAGHHAGMWTVAVVKTGNAIGLSQAEIEQLPKAEFAQRLSVGRASFAASRPHYIIDGVADLLPVLDAIDARIAAGEHP
jgi:phosphonoacetaldehyde hydrolase